MRRISWGGLSILLMCIFWLGAGAAAAANSATVVQNPDAYRCTQPGFIGFETLPDQTDLSVGTIAGLHFTTTGGYTWLVGDFAAGGYNGKYPSGDYTSEGTHWAWLGPDQGAGRIDFVNGPASYFSLLVSNGVDSVYLDAYNAADTLLETAGPSLPNIDTGTMVELAITRTSRDIAYVIVHDSGNYFLVDSICTDAPGVSEIHRTNAPVLAMPQLVLLGLLMWLAGAACVRRRTCRS